MTFDPEARHALGRRLGHEFVDIGLLEEALTHPSARAEARNAASYERLEFLGDRVLGLIVADLLLHRFPDEPEGALSRRYAALVRGETLADVARALDLGRYMVLSRGERRASGASEPANLDDLCEALIGALYLDGGLEAARRFVCTQWEPFLDAAAGPPQDAKTALQEWAQAGGRGLPVYRVVASTGPAHAPEFVIEVEVAGVGRARGRGASKRAGEQVAAAALLDRVGAGDGCARAAS